MAGFANDVLRLGEAEDGMKMIWSSEIPPPFLAAPHRCHSRCFPLTARNKSRCDHCNLDLGARDGTTKVHNGDAGVAEAGKHSGGRGRGSFPSRSDLTM